MTNPIKTWLQKLNIIAKIGRSNTRKKISLKRPKEWVSKNRKKIIITLCGAIVAMGVILAYPSIAAQYDTYITIPNHFTDQERDQAVARWKDIIGAEEKGKNNAGMYNNIGILRGSLKDYPGAIRAFKRAKQRNPEDPRFDRNMGITYTYMNEYKKAEKAFRNAVTLAPKNSEYWLELGELYAYYLRDYAKARAFYIDAIAQNEGDLDILKSYANFLENVDMDYREALKYWRVLMDNDKEHTPDYLKKIESTKRKLE